MAVIKNTESQYGGTPSLRFDERVSFNNMLSIMLYEGLIMNYPIDKTINYVKKLFNIPDDSIRESEGAIMITIIVPKQNNMTTLNKLIRAMQLCGYFLSVSMMDAIKNLGGLETTLQFEEKYDQKMKNEILKDEKELLHITQSKNVDKIKSIGLTPSSINKLFDYPERIYLLKGSIPHEDIINLAEMPATIYNLHNENGKIDYDYSVLHLDLSRIPDTVRLFPDLDYESYGLYTIDNIPPSAITNINTLT